MNDENLNMQGEMSEEKLSAVVGGADGEAGELLGSCSRCGLPLYKNGSNARYLLTPSGNRLVCASCEKLLLRPTDVPKVEN